MKQFKYTIRDEAGLRHEGTRKAVCQHDVLMWARDNNFIPISVEEVGLTKKKRKQRNYGRVKSADIANFCWQLATMMEGGISIIESLETIADDMDNVRVSLTDLNTCSEIAKYWADQDEQNREYSLHRAGGKWVCHLVISIGKIGDWITATGVDEDSEAVAIAEVFYKLKNHEES